MSVGFPRVLSALALLALAASASFAAPRPKTWAPPVIAAATAAVDASDDPDVPRLGVTLDKEEYLLRRSSHEAEVRGPFDQAWAGRQKAIQDMKRQIDAQGPFSVGPSWTAIGPNPIPNGQTTSIQTPVSGRTTSIAVHPTNPNIVYVGTAQGGIYRTTNGGTTWVAIFDGAATLAIGHIALAPSNPSILYVGTGEAHGSCDSYFGLGVYRIDNADTAPVLSGPFNPLVTTGIVGTTAFTGRTISRVLVHPTNPDIIFVSTSSGIGGIGCDALSTTVPPLALRGLYRSTNATSASPSFQKITVTTAGSLAPDVSGNRSITDMVFDPADPNRLVCWVLGTTAANDGGVWLSTNALAATPTFTRTIATTVSNARGEFAVTTQGGATKYLVATGETGAGTSCTTGSGALRRSLDGGATWSAKLAGGGGFCGGQCFYDIAVAMPPGDTSTVVLGGAGNGTCSRVLTRSTNGGVSFTAAGVTDVGLHADTHALAFAPSNPSIAYTGSDGGIFKSTNGGASWTSLNNTGYSATQFQSLAVHPTDPNFTIGGTQDNGTNWYRPNATWTRADFGDGGFALIDQSSANTTATTMYHTYFNGQNSIQGFARVTNTACATDGQWVYRGANFSDPTIGCEGVALAAANGITGTSPVLFYAPIALGPGNPNTIYFGNDRLFRSINRGDAMSVVSQAPIFSGAVISAIGISPTDDNTRIVGLNNGQVWATNTGSSTLTNVTGTIPAKYVARAIIDPTNSNTAWVTLAGFGLPAGQHVWKTTNLMGGVWTAAGSGIPDVPVNALVVDPLLPNVAYAGTDIGVYVTNDGGASWQPFMTGMPTVAVFDIAIQNNARILRCATHGRGMFERALDNPTPTQLALVGSEIVAGKARMTWYSADGAGETVKLYRRSVPGEWAFVQDLDVNGEGQIVYEDASVQPGSTYQYVLGARGQDGTERFYGHVWVTVPRAAGLALAAITPNPTKRSMRVSFVLPAEGAASVELVDITGRRIASRDVGAMGAGRHDVTFENEGLAPGTYFVRLIQASRQVSMRVSVVR